MTFRLLSTCLPVLILSWLVAGLSVASAQTSSSGVVVVTSASAQVKAGTTVMAEVKSGERLNFVRRSGELFLVEIGSGGNKRQCWINRRDVFVDLLRVVRNGIRTSRPGYGLKELEAFLDFDREAEVKDGGTSIVMFDACSCVSDFMPTA